MTDRFDEAKRALEGVPAPDVWAEAERRAGDGTVAPLAADGGGRRPGRWLAAAAAVTALLVGTAVVLAADDDAPVESGPATSPGDPAGDVTTYQADGAWACTIGIAGEPLPEPVKVSPAETFVEGTVGTLIEGLLNGNQTFAVQVPGQVVTDLVGERVEDVQLQRGTAQLWFQDSTDPIGLPLRPVQVRWFPGSQEPCESFTVTVSGGTEDENRHAAVDLAERVLMIHELPDDQSPGDNLDTAEPGTATTEPIGDEPTDDPTPSEPYAIWPVGSSSSESGFSSSPFVGSVEETAVEFARQVLGWDDATVVRTEPNDELDAIAEVTVASPSLGRETGVLIDEAAPASDGHVVVRVGLPVAASVEFQVIDGKAAATVNEVLDGTESTEIRFIYGHDYTLAASGQEVEVDSSVPGAILVLFRDADGDIIGAWGIGNPPGNASFGATA